jgi:hypothetical protein
MRKPHSIVCRLIIRFPFEIWRNIQTFSFEILHNIQRRALFATMMTVAFRSRPTQRDHQDDNNDTYSCGTGVATVKVSNRSYQSENGTLIRYWLARFFCLGDNSLPDKSELDCSISKLNNVENMDKEMEMECYGASSEEEEGFETQEGTSRMLWVME